MSGRTTLTPAPSASSRGHAANYVITSTNTEVAGPGRLPGRDGEGGGHSIGVKVWGGGLKGG